MIIRYIICILFLCSVGYGAGKTALLFVKDMGELSLYDKFEAPMSRLTAQKMGKNVLLEIIDDKYVFGDQISSGKKVQLHGKIFYILTKENGTIIGGQGNVSKLSNSEILTDTLTINASRGIHLYNNFQFEIPTLKMKNGNSVVLLYGYKKSIYVYSSNDKQYGWIKKTMLNFLEKKVVDRKAVSENVFTKERINELRSYLVKINKFYKQYFEFFNEEDQKSLPTPFWKVQRVKNGLICKLHDIDQPQKLDESSRYIHLQIENIFGGSTVKITREIGAIKILVPGE